MRRITFNLPVYYSGTIEVADDATIDDIFEAIDAEVPKHVTVRVYDVDNADIVNDEAVVE